MSAEQIFSIANITALIGWAVLLVGYLIAGSRKLAAFAIVPALLSGAYAVLIVAFFGQSEGDFGSLAGVATLFENHYVLLAGWIHYLAFDLLTGTLVVEHARSSGVPFWIVLPCLPFVFLLGPIGFLMYWTLQILFTRSLAITGGAR